MKYIRSLLSFIDHLLFPFEYSSIELPIQTPFTSDQLMNFFEVPELDAVQLIRRHRKTGLYEAWMPCTPQKKDVIASAIGYDWFMLPTEIQKRLEISLESA